MHVQITMDFPCAWSYIAFARYQRLVREARRAGGRFDVEFRPFQMDPTATTRGERKRDVERSHFGAAFDLDAAYAQLNEHGAQEGVVFGQDAVWANTFEAHRLVRVASRQGKGEAMVSALFRAQHTDGQNVASPSVLRQLADAVGVEWSDDGSEETAQALEGVSASGVRAIPVFAFDGGPTFTGLPDERQLRAVLAQATQT